MKAWIVEESTNQLCLSDGRGRLLSIPKYAYYRRELRSVCETHNLCLSALERSLNLLDESVRNMEHGQHPKGGYTAGLVKRSKQFLGKLL